MTQQLDPHVAAVPAIKVDTPAAAVAEDPRWLERVARGTFCLMWLVPLDALARLLFPVLLLELRLAYNDPPALFWSRLVVAGTAAVFAVCGGYLLSLRNPADREADPRSLFRPLLWVAVLMWAAGEFCCLYPARSHSFLLWNTPLRIAMTARQAGELVAFGAICLLLMRLVRLTTRTLGPTLGTRLRRAVRLYVAFLAVAALSDTWATTAAFHPRTLPTPLRHPPGLLAAANVAALAFVPLVVLAMYLSPLFYRLGHTFRRRGEAARELGATPGAAKGFAVLEKRQAPR